MDVLGGAPVPSICVDTCVSDGFKLNSGAWVLDGDGVLLVGGEAFAWRPWSREKKLVNHKGQWDVPDLKSAFGLLGLIWPRPGML